MDPLTNNPVYDPTEDEICYELPPPSNPEEAFFASLALSSSASAQHAEGSDAGPQNIRDIGIAINTRQRRAVTLHVPIRGLGSAWHDQDDSGNYDPKLEEVEERKRRILHRRKNQEKNLSREALVIVLLFKSKEALKVLATFPGGQGETSGRDDNEVNSDDSASEEGRVRRRRKNPFIKRRQGNDKAIKSQSYVITPSRERISDEVSEEKSIRRSTNQPAKKCKGKSKANKSSLSAQRSSDAEASVENAPFQPRKYVSCNQCRISGKQSCRLQKDEKGPCTHCQRLKQACTFVDTDPSIPVRPISSAGVQARKYVSCNRCRANSITCNLKRHEEGPCSQCRKTGRTCEFVYVFTSKPRKISLTTTSARDEEAESMTRTLLQEAYNIGGKKSRKHASLHRRAVKNSTRSRDQNEAEDQAGMSGGTFMDRSTSFIETAFCHPIAFNWIPPEETKDFGDNSKKSDVLNTQGSPESAATLLSCSFHPLSSPFFCLFGHGTRTVEVFPWPDINGKGYEEISGGHYERGAEESKMCIECTTERVGTILCPGHRIVEFPRYDAAATKNDDGVTPKPWGNDARVFDSSSLEKSFSAVLHGDIDGTAGGKLAWETIWCSICPSPAGFACSASSECKLRLCAECKHIYDSVARDCEQKRVIQASYANRGLAALKKVEDSMVLEEVIRLAGAKHMKDKYPFGLRADVGFLRREGELMKRLSWDNGEGELGG